MFINFNFTCARKNFVKSVDKQKSLFIQKNVKPLKVDEFVFYALFVSLVGAFLHQINATFYDILL